MPVIKPNQCGFLTVIYYMDCKNQQEFREFHERHKLIAGINTTYWRKNHKAAKKELVSNIYYINKNNNREMESFMKTFSLNNYKKLADTERQRHSYYNCQQCILKHSEVFKLGFRNTIMPAQQAHQELTPNTNCSFQPNSNRKRKVSDVELISKKAKREILKEATDNLSKDRISRDFIALYASKQSEREWERQRMECHREHRKSINKRHIGNMAKYTFNAQLLDEFIRTAADLTNPNSDINWSKTAMEIKLTRPNGQIPNNRGQVLKEIIRRRGFDVPIKRKRRSAWTNFKGHKLNAPKATSVKVLKAKKQDVIASGEFDVGQPVVPVEFEVMTISDDGKLVRTAHEVAGRKFSLKTIRQDHLKRMKGLKLLRNIEQDMTDTDIAKFLEKRGVTLLPDECPKQKLNKLLTTRNMVMWHDHSDIAGKSHYLFITWFLYDDIVYLTDEEMASQERPQVNVQSAVEAPYVYLLARSGCAVKDQLLYVPTRMEDLLEMEERLSVDGIMYTDVIRFFSGDSPARQLEAGQQCGGNILINLPEATSYFAYQQAYLPSFFSKNLPLSGG